MTVSSAANAVLAKARAMYGKRLTAQNYTDLLACRSVNEAAAYLKAHTAYADTFEGVTMGSLRRWQIEILLREHLSNNFASLCRYEKSIGDGFYKYFVTLSDVNMLLHSVRYLNSRHPEKNLAKVPDFFVRHSELNAAALETATNVDLLLAAVEGSPYKAVLAPFASVGSDGRPDYFAMELALNKYLYSQAEALVKKNYKGKERKELDAMHAFDTDAENIVSLYRLKRLTNMPQSVLTTMLMPGGTLDEKALTGFMKAPDAEKALQTLKGTAYAAFAERGDRSVEQVSAKLRYDRAKGLVRFSTFPSVVMMSYVALAENEAENLTHIIEGIRYNIPPEEISRLLIGVGD